MKGYMNRHQAVLLRKEENTSLCCAPRFTVTILNDTSVQIYLTSYLNMNETALSTVVQFSDIATQMETKQAGQAVSAKERNV
jgi:hypothetical protein